jgi:hypothetical protein
MRRGRRLFCLMRLPIRRHARERGADLSRGRRPNSERRGSRPQPSALDVFLFAAPVRNRRERIP